MADIVLVRIERLELVHQLALRRLEGLAGCHVEVPRHLVDLQEAKEVAALVDACQPRWIQKHSLVHAEWVILPL